ncbi:MAG: HNH endonuclease signature motif containing protein [Phormidesmis sp.]
MAMVSKPLRRLVIQRAGNRCEYCGLSQVGQAATFHIDHVIPVAADGPTTEKNLALACVACSLYKGARQKVKDVKTSRSVTIFNPRRQIWTRHFVWVEFEILGLTAVGRATVDALKLNRAVILAIRAEEKLLGRHPPP